MTTHLSPLLTRAAAPTPPHEEGAALQLARVLNVASLYAGNLRMDDVEFVTRAYSPAAAYMQAKQANRMMTWAWSRRLQSSNVLVNAIHPGAVAGTQLAKHLGTLKFACFTGTKVQILTQKAHI